jgi:hypothetical protein
VRIPGPESPSRTDPAGLARSPDPSPAGLAVRLLVSALEATFAIALAGFTVLVVTACDGSYAGTDMCDGTPPGQAAFLLVMVVFAATVILGAAASVVVPAVDRRRLVYRLPAGALLLVALAVSALLG